MTERILQLATRRFTALNAPLKAVAIASAFYTRCFGCAAWRGLGLIAQKRGLSVALVGFLGLFGSIGIALLVHIPQPIIHDEFSYLLASDTFASGRVTNATHPMWIHFESFHIIHQPTYQSKYPPAQGLILAAGQVIGGHPIVGVWISIGLMGAAICWMLYAWLPPRWALFGALLATLQVSFFGSAVSGGTLMYWSQSYWGGAVATIGGALVYGALRRIMCQPRVRDAVVMGLGIAILANSRPLEGLVASLPVAAVLGWRMFSRKAPPVSVSMGRVVLPILAVLAPTVAAMGYYNLRVTGDALRMPYQVHETTYFPRSSFLVANQSRPQPTYRHQTMRDFYIDRPAEVEKKKSSTPLLGNVMRKAKQFWKLWQFYLGFVLTIPLVMLPWLIKDNWMRFALLTCGIEIVASASVSRMFPHYAAPVTGLVFVLVIQAMRYLQVCQWAGAWTGRFVVRMIPVILIASVVPVLGQKMKANPDWSLQRARVLERLGTYAGSHLVIVRYGARHSSHKEWIYNEADIDSAKVVWAREIDSAQNRKLLEYFTDRQAWLLEVNGDDSPQKLAHYPMRSDYSPAATAGNQVHIQPEALEGAEKK